MPTRPDPGPVAWSLAGVRCDVGGVRVLDGVDLEVRAGDRVLLLGASGGGKTTLVRCGLGLRRPDAGRVALFGEDTAGWGAARWQRARREVQVLFQDPLATLHPGLPVGDSLRETAAWFGVPEVRAWELLCAVGLPDGAPRLPRELSGGERRRASLARVLLPGPRLLVADEPTAGLDAPLQADVVATLFRVLPDAAVVVVTHDPAPFLPHVHRICLLEGGRIAEELRPGERPASALGRATFAAAGADGSDPLARTREAIGPG